LTITDEAAPAALVLPGTAPEADWLEARRTGVTASEIAIIMGLSPYGSPFEMFHRKSGTLPPSQPDSEAMALGRHMESYIAERFGERYPGLHLAGTGRELYASPARAWQMATPDRLAYEAQGAGEPHLLHMIPPLAVLECKVDGGSDEWGEDGSDEIPVHYRCQVLWQMDVMGADAGFVACLMWQRRKIRVYELGMDDAARADLALMRDAAEDFLARIEHDEAPDVDWRPATAAALKHLHPTVEDREVAVGRQLTRSYRAAYRNFKAAEKRKDEMTNRVLAEMGSARTAVEAATGAKVAGRQVYDVKESVRKAYTVNKLVIARGSK
jgi:putative phage-type endonuclease